MTAVAIGAAHSCALTSAGGLRCWGENGSSQLGDGSTAYTPHPVDVVGLKAGVAAVTAGSQFTCALTTSGGVKCWGANNVGQLGNGSTAGTAVPTDVVGLTSGVAEISAGWDHACARTTGGQVLCWGYNGSGKIGNGVTVGVTRVP